MGTVLSDGQFLSSVPTAWQNEANVVCQQSHWHVVSLQPSSCRLTAVSEIRSLGCHELFTLSSSDSTGNCALLRIINYRKLF